jgi:RNA-directed DNA polymerase
VEGAGNSRREPLRDQSNALSLTQGQIRWDTPSVRHHMIESTSASLDVRIVALARAFASGAQDVETLTARGALAVTRPPRMVRPVAERFVAAFAGRTRPRHREIVTFLLQDRSYADRPVRSGWHTPAVRRLVWSTEASRMQPVSAAAAWKVPALETVGALADWLGVTVEALAWYADVRTAERRDPTAPRHHYHYLLKHKAHGGVRLLEAPQATLKALQRQVLGGILNHVPPYYTAAHGFVRGRSARTYAAEHVGKRVVLRMDLEDFFPTISGVRVQALFRTMGYPEAVADTLGGLCTTITPRTVLRTARWPSVTAAQLRTAQQLYARPHLPQGAPTSPALANLCAHRLDCRITGLADWAGAVYSRYADDIAFSGGSDVARHIARYATQIAVIANEEGWQVQHRKTRIMRQGVQQRLAGIVVNAHPNVPRRDYDALKAVLTNCVRHGQDTQNREQHPDFRSHLAGRVAWVRSLNETKGQQLQALFERITWPDTDSEASDHVVARSGGYGSSSGSTEKF